MLLNIVQTGVLIHSPVDIDSLQEKAQAAFLECVYGLTGEGHFHRTDAPFPDQPGIIISGIMGVTGFRLVYRPDGTQIHTQEEYDERQEACEAPGCKPENHAPPHHVGVAFDHNLHQDFAGRNAGQVHEEILYRLGYWLDENSIPWSWVNWLIGPVQKDYSRASELGPLCTAKIRESNVRAALAAAGPVPAESLLGMTILADRVAARRARDKN